MVSLSNHERARITPTGLRYRPMTRGRLHRADRSRRYEYEPREVGSVPARVAGEELVAGNRCVGADVEVGERSDAVPSPAPVRKEAAPGQERRLIGQGIAAVEVGRERLLEVLHAIEADRYL